MITGDGKTYIKRYLAGQVPSIAQSIAFGLGTKVEAVGDTALQFEVGRSPIALTTYDFVNNKLLFKAAVDEKYAGAIYEVALFSTPANTSAGEFSSRLLTTFDSGSEEWVDASSGLAESYVSAPTRIGGDSLSHAPAPTTTKTSSLRSLFLDLSGYSNNDVFNFAYNVNNGNCSGISFKFLTDAANYYTITLGAQTTGYKIVTAAKATAVPTGTPNWATITEMQVATSASAVGAAQVDYDGIRMEDMDTINPNYVMVSRELLGTPFIKEDGKVQDIEFSLDVSV